MSEKMKDGKTLKTKLSTGTVNTKGLELSAVEICRIIRESAKSGVEELRLGDLHLKFGPEGQSGLPKNKSASKSFPAGPLETPTPESSELLALSNSDEDAMKGYLEAQELLQNPLRFEQSLMDSSFEEEIQSRGGDAPGDDELDERAI